MKHSIKHRKLNRNSSHRKALLMNLSNALLKHEQIQTTLPKAKELKPFVEKIITLGKKGDLHSRRKAISILQDQSTTKKVFDVFADRYKDRLGGYTRIIKLEQRSESLSNIQLALKQNSNDFFGLNIKGLLLYSLNKIEHAIKVFKDAINLNNNYPDSYNNLGYCYIEIENLDKAFYFLDPISLLKTFRQFSQEFY